MSFRPPQGILCALDLSPASARTVAWAGLLARAFGAPLEILHADWWEPPRYFTKAQIDELAARAEEHRRHLSEEIAALVEEALGPDAEHETRITEGRPADAILAEAANATDRWLVLGSHGRTGLARLRLGSVAEEVVRRAQQPVLVVNVVGTAERAARVRQVLCPINFTPLAIQSLDMAAGLAKALGARLWVVHALEGEGGNLAEAHQRLCEWVPSDVRRRCEVSEAVRQGNAAEQILLLAREQPADLIVLGAARQPLLEWTTLGSTTERVVRHSSCPVLVLPPATES